ncbi:hypothetical protein [Cribrihabitans neustonicus]|uniref:hypothetical protein n=1 Tax=Cribrihabitans neustonicus TaxID=1429085 RepID=UPI003B59C841
MESTFRIIFWAGLAGCAAWFWYTMFQPMTVLVEAAGVSAGTLLLIGAAGLLYFWIPQAFDLGKANKVAEATAQNAVTRAKSVKSEVLTKAKPWHWGLVAVVILALFAGWSMMKSAERAEADLSHLVTQVRSTCASWLNKEMNGSNRINPAWANDAWQKKGHIVVEVVWKEGSSHRSRLCVYDPSTRKMDSPGAFGRVRWEKQ